MWVRRSGADILSERGVGLIVNTDTGCGESGRESGRVRRGCREALVRLWNITVTAADTHVGDADVSGRSGSGVTTPLLVGDTGRRG